MKPTVPETGKVIKIDKNMAVVLLTPEKSCKGCGAAAIGLCKPSGNMSALTVRNDMNAAPGDTVRIELDKSTRKKGFLLAYIIPIISFMSGSLIGYIINKEFSIPSLEVITGFGALVVSAMYSLRKLKKLDSAASMNIARIVSSYTFSVDTENPDYVAYYRMH